MAAAGSFDDLVGAAEQRNRNGETERLSVDCQHDRTGPAPATATLRPRATGYDPFYSRREQEWLCISSSVLKLQHRRSAMKVKDVMHKGVDWSVRTLLSPNSRN